MSLELTLNEPQINLSWVNSTDHLIYEFHNYRLDADHLMLYRGGEEISLTPKQVETLLALIEKNGEIVSKDVLMTRLWGDTAVEEANLIQNIHYLRKELGNAPDGKPMIETLRRRGYRFTADLKTTCNGKIVARSNAINANEVPPWYQQRTVAIALAALGLLGLVIVAGSFLFSSRSAPVGTRMQFAVLPLKPIDAANRSDIYEIGVADSLINRLNSISGLVARPLGATRKYDALDQDPLAAGREQRVDRVLASNYQLVDGKFRLTAQLINVASGQVEESYKVETDAGSVFAIQDAVASEIGNKLMARFGATTGSTLKRGTSNEEAYRLYLQGKNLTIKRNAESYKKAIEYFEQAIRLDPNYAQAYARMAHAYYSSGLPENDSANAEKAKQFINKALELDPNAAEAYVSRGYVEMLYDWDLSAAEKDFLRAIELEPNNDTAHWLYALVLTYHQRFDEGLAEIETALSIDPGVPVYMVHRGRILYYARRYDEAITQYQQAIDLDDRAMPYAWLVRLYETKGDYASAYQSFLKREERSPRKDQIEIFQKVYETSGWRGLKEKEAELATGRFFDLARLYALQGEKDAAFENLNKAVEERQWLMTTINVEPAFDNLRNDPRFAELLTRVGFKGS